MQKYGFLRNVARKSQTFYGVRSIMSFLLLYIKEKRAAGGNASTTVGKLQYHRGGTPVLARWY